MGKLEHNTTDELQLKLSSSPTPHDEEDEDEDGGPSTFTTFELRLFPSSYYSLVLTTDDEDLALLQENQVRFQTLTFETWQKSEPTLTGSAAYFDIYTSVSDVAKAAQLEHVSFQQQPREQNAKTWQRQFQVILNMKS